MKAMVLAAGYGTRLRPVTDRIPKPLLPVGGTPLIVWNLLLLRHHGVHDVVINLHHLGHLIEKELGNGTQWGMHLTYSHEPVILGTGGGIKEVESLFKGEPFLVLNGDTLMDLNLTELIEWHDSRRCLATMVLRDDPDIEKWGVVETTVEGRVITINSRGWPSQNQKPTILRYMFAGVHVMDPRLLRHCPKDQTSSIIDAYVAELETGAMIGGYVASGYWSDVGTPERYAQAQQDAQNGLITLASRA